MMYKVAIDQAVADLHRRIWLQRIALGIDAGSYVATLDPAIGASALGVQFAIEDSLGSFGNCRERFSVAGLINRQQNLIQVSAQFPETTQRFTGVHELGHFVLHNGEVMHRDRPVAGASGVLSRRGAVEIEADYFAACYLMPSKLVYKAFEVRFGFRRQFVADDAAAYYLQPNDPEKLLSASADEIAAILETATRYGGLRFGKMSDEFKVSVPAMAIRLTELGLVA